MSFFQCASSAPVSKTGMNHPLPTHPAQGSKSPFVVGPSPYPPNVDYLQAVIRRLVAITDTLGEADGGILYSRGYFNQETMELISEARALTFKK